MLLTECAFIHAVHCDSTVLIVTTVDVRAYEVLCVDFSVACAGECATVGERKKEESDQECMKEHIVDFLFAKVAKRGNEFSSTGLKIFCSSYASYIIAPTRSGREH